ncbi:MAG TPA: hypothetical protein VD884_17140 [Ohtaekwangia sp.]|nr:hypothetical protein [Ohtaekwangia sp.]
MRKIFFLLFFTSVYLLHGQTVLETNPTSLKWFQVKTPHFNVLYPEGFEDQAQRMANTFEHIRVPESNSMGTAPGKISIILQNQSAISNGFVSMFPRRSEFYTMPSQDYNFYGTNDWLNLLASHEYRHIVQYQHALRGINRAVYYLFGSPTFSGLAHAAAPDWFWEGDAVATETAFTPGGRGGIPNFGLLFRTNLLEGRKFNYHKQYLQSYKHNIPNHYVLGYHMISYLRHRTADRDIWEKIMKRSWSVPFIPFAFSNAIKNKTGLYVTDLYNEMASDLKTQWQAQVDSLNLSSFETVNKRTSKAYTDYMYPQPQPDGSVLALKRGIGEIEKFILLKDGNDKPAFTPGMLNESGMLSSTGGVVVWNEYGFDERWQVRNYSLVKAFDLNKKEKIVVSGKRSRHAGAAISPDGKKLVTVQTDTKYQHRLQVLSFPDGKLIMEFKNPENDFYSMPRWRNDGLKIVALKTTSFGRSVHALDPITGEDEVLLTVTKENIGHPVWHDHYLFFNTPASGIDNIHVVDLHTMKRYQVTSSKYGAYNAAISVDQKFIYYNEQTSNGMDVVRIPFNPSPWKEYKSGIKPDPLAEVLIEQEGRPGLFDSIPKQVYPVRKYAKLSHVINPFSWGAFVQNDLANVDIGISSQDLLSTTSIGLGYRYDLNERTGMWRAGLSYQGLFPIIDVTYTQGNRSVDEGDVRISTIHNGDTTHVMRNVTFTWEEKNVNVGLRVPLNFTSSKYSSGLTFGNEVGYTRVTDFRNDSIPDRSFPGIITDENTFYYNFLDYIGNGNLIFNHGHISAHRLLKRSKRDIHSRWGQAFYFNHYKTAFGGDFDGELLSATAYLFFPGFAKHHSLNGYVAFQRTSIGKSRETNYNDYVFRNTIPLPRGQSISQFEDVFATSVNYTLPVWYPDIALGPILNIQRFRLNVFSDYAMGKYAYFSGGRNTTYHVVGGELTVDFNILRFLPQFNLGVRYSYGVSPSFTNVELIIGTFNF